MSLPDKYTTPHPRLIKSFAIRAGRMSTRQQQALTQNNYLLDPGSPIDWQRELPSPSPSVTLEIGFGMGHSLIQHALAAPNSYFIGMEVFSRGIGALLAEITTHNLSNIRVLQGDAVELIQRLIPNNSLDTIQIFFPDPWPKRRHHKRRLIQPAFVQLIVEKLKPGGHLHLATDWEDYALHMMRVLSDNKELSNTAGAGKFTTQRMGRPLTKYEQRGQRLGHGVWDFAV